MLERLQSETSRRPQRFIRGCRPDRRSRPGPACSRGEEPVPEEAERQVAPLLHALPPPLLLQLLPPLQMLRFSLQIKTRTDALQGGQSMRGVPERTRDRYRDRKRVRADTDQILLTVSDAAVMASLSPPDAPAATLCVKTHRGTGSAPAEPSQ